MTSAVSTTGFSQRFLSVHALERTLTTLDAALAGCMQMSVLLLTHIVRHARLARYQVKTDRYGFFLTSDRLAFDIDIPSEVSFVAVSCVVLERMPVYARRWKQSRRYSTGRLMYQSGQGLETSGLGISFQLCFNGCETSTFLLLIVT